MGTTSLYGNNGNSNLRTMTFMANNTSNAPHIPKKDVCPDLLTSKRVQIQVPHHRNHFEVEWNMGESLLDVAKSSSSSSWETELLSEYLEGACGGQMSCSTCHVYLDPDTYQCLLQTDEREGEEGTTSDALLQEVSEAEQDMLECAYEPREGSSRLACQCQWTRALQESQHTIVVTIPSGANNMWS
jgi:ferredoxin